MAARSNWKGFVRVSLVTFSVAMYNATESSRRKISFRQINRDTGNPVKQSLVDAETGEAVPREDLVKGYEYEKGKFIQIEPEELDELKLESSKTIDIDQFVTTDEIDELYIDAPYYLLPDGPVAEESYGLIRDAMREEEVAGIARLVMSGRERVVALKPKEKGLELITLRYGEEVRKPEPFFAELEEASPNGEMMDLARKLVKDRKGSFDPDAYHDRYAEAVLEVVKAKLAGREPELPEAEEETGKVVSLMDALRKSVGEEKKKPAKSAQQRKKAGGKKASQSKSSGESKASGQSKSSGAKKQKAS